MSESKFKCLLKNCSINSDDDRMISCWLCHGLCHFKCSGLKTLVAEALRNVSGLHWCCWDCRKIGAEFYRFFQNTTKKFLDLKDQAAKLNESINAYGKLFDDFKSLDNLKSPPVPSPKRRKSARNIDKEKRDTNPVVTVNPQNQLPSTSTTNINSSNESDLNSVDYHPTYAETVLSTVAENVPATYNNEQPFSEDIVYNPLRAVPAKKTIFVSRLTSDTTADAVNHFIKNKIGNDADILIQKFNFPQPRYISSFKITVPANLFATLLNLNFWPTNTLVREYIYKPRSQNIGVLPQHESTASKN